MKLSIETYNLRQKFNDETAITLIKNAGFDAYDFSFFLAYDNNVLGDDYLDIAKKLKKHSDEIGIECNQTHAPWDIRYTDDFDIGNENFKMLVRSLEFSSVLGAKNVVVHAIKELPDNIDFYELNYKFYKSLEPYCEKYKICVSVENIFNHSKETGYVGVLNNPKELKDFVLSLNSPWFNICIDVGHCTITGYEPEQVISALNNKILKALHIHDNDYKADSHQLPYLGKMNWQNIMMALKKIDYKGDFTFELTGFFYPLKNDVIPAALKLAEQTGRMILKYF